MGRVHRLGQTKACIAYSLIAKHTSDTYIVSMSDDKGAMHQKLTQSIGVDVTLRSYPLCTAFRSGCSPKHVF